MKRIGILSDTHSHWDEKFAHYFHDCDEIWHAGDIGTMDVADQLAQIAPLRAVAGNIDGADIRREFGLMQRFKCEDVNVMLTHIAGYPGHYDRQIFPLLQRGAPDLLVCGHSHILKIQYDKLFNMLSLNPGAAGLFGWQPERTVVRLTIEGNKFTDCEVINLGKPKIKSHE